MADLVVTPLDPAPVLPPDVTTTAVVTVPPVVHKWLTEIEIVKGASGWDDAAWKAAVAASLVEVPDAATRESAAVSIAEDIARMIGWVDGRDSEGAPVEVVMQLQVGDVAAATTIRVRITRPN
jgi:hypothetical protein